MDNARKLVTAWRDKAAGLARLLRPSRKHTGWVCQVRVDPSRPGRRNNHSRERRYMARSTSTVSTYVAIGARRLTTCPRGRLPRRGWWEVYTRPSGGHWRRAGSPRSWRNPQSLWGGF